MAETHLLPGQVFCSGVDEWLAACKLFRMLVRKYVAAHGGAAPSRASSNRTTARLTGDRAKHVQAMVDAVRAKLEQKRAKKRAPSRGTVRCVRERHGFQASNL